MISFWIIKHFNISTWKYQKDRKATSGSWSENKEKNNNFIWRRRDKKWLRCRLIQWQSHGVLKYLHHIFTSSSGFRHLDFASWVRCQSPSSPSQAPAERSHFHWKQLKVKQKNITEEIFVFIWLERDLL